MSSTFTVRVNCPACHKRVRLPAQALHELGAKLSVVLTCPECGATRPVSVLRGSGLPPAAAPAPTVAPPPFRPLIAPTAPAAEEPAPAPARPPRPTKPAPVEPPQATPSPAPVKPVEWVESAPPLAPAPVPAPRPAPPVPAPALCAPFAPLETVHGHVQAEPPPAAPTLGTRWRNLRPAQRQQLALALGLALLVAGLGGVKKWQRTRAEAAEAPVAAAPTGGPAESAPAARERPAEGPRRAGRDPEPPPPARPGRAAARDARGEPDTRDVRDRRIVD